MLRTSQTLSVAFKIYALHNSSSITLFLDSLVTIRHARKTKFFHVFKATWGESLTFKWFIFRMKYSFKKVPPIKEFNGSNQLRSEEQQQTIKLCSACASLCVYTHYTTSVCLSVCIGGGSLICVLCVRDRNRDSWVNMNTHTHSHTRSRWGPWPSQTGRGCIPVWRFVLIRASRRCAAVWAPSLRIQTRRGQDLAVFV